MKKRATYEILGRDYLDRQISSLIGACRHSIEKMSDSKLLFSYGNALENVAPIDTIRLCKEICYQNNFGSTTSNLLINTVYEAERRVCGSGFVALVAFLEFFPHFLKASKFNDKTLTVNLEKRINSDLKQLVRASRRSSSFENFNFLHSFVRNQSVESAAKIALEAAGSAGNISVDKFDQEELRIEKVSGNRFLIKLDSNFLGAIPQKEIKLFQPKVLVVDGIIENFAEIESLIQSAHRENSQLAIFARGFNEKISSSFASNFSAKIVNIIPFVVNYDEHGVNQLVDIAICSGTDIFSSIKGDLIENIAWQSLPVVEEILVDRSFVTMFNSKTLENCSKQRAKLVKDLEECNKIANDEVREMKFKILNQRINSMTTSNTSIKIGKYFKDFQNVYHDRLCKSVEIFNETSRWGLIELKDISAESEVLQSLVSTFRHLGIENISPRMLDTGVKIAASNVKNTLSVGAWLKNEAA